jgi:extradiol dioxygenase family protein
MITGAARKTQRDARLWIPIDLVGFKAVAHVEHPAMNGGCDDVSGISVTVCHQLESGRGFG